MSYLEGLGQMQCAILNFTGCLCSAIIVNWRRKNFRVKSRSGQKLLNFNKMMEKYFFRENNYQQVYLPFFSSNFLNFCSLTLRSRNKTGGLKNITWWVRTQFLWKSRFFEFFWFKFFQKEQFKSQFCFFLKKSSYLVDCGVEGTQTWAE